MKAYIGWKRNVPGLSRGISVPSKLGHNRSAIEVAIDLVDVSLPLGFFSSAKYTPRNEQASRGHWSRLFQLLADFEDSVLENSKIR